MTTIIEEINDWIRQHQDAHWGMMDGRLLYQLGAAPAVVSIRELLKTTGPLNTDKSSAPQFAVHFWHTDSHPYDAAGLDYKGGGYQIIHTSTSTDHIVIDDGYPHLQYLGWATGLVGSATDAPVVPGE